MFGDGVSRPRVPSFEYASAAERLRPLGLPVRLRIIDMIITSGPMAVSDVATAVGLGQPTASHHLAALAKSGWLARHRSGRSAIYDVVDAEEVQRLLATVAGSRPSM